MSPEIVLATAGLGTSEFLAAGIRVIEQAKGFRIFNDCKLLTAKNLPILCPTVSRKYKGVLNTSTRGYGFMSWKSEIAYRTLTEYEGNVFYFWVDAGCEMFPTPLGRLKMKRYVRQLEQDGYLFFTLDTPECEYTKASLFDYFPALSKQDRTPQAQTTFFGLYGKTGQNIAERWFDVVTNNIDTVNEQGSYAYDGSEVRHRHDQSVFSLVLKEMGFKPNIQPLRSDKNSSPFLNRLKYLTQPILACRNRTGKSVAKWH